MGTILPAGFMRIGGMKFMLLAGAQDIKELEFTSLATAMRQREMGGFAAQGKSSFAKWLFQWTRS